jgi:transcription initiation factor TFIIIB Brf1 subunit/transcription initiation factor TFIIB
VLIDICENNCLTKQVADQAVSFSKNLSCLANKRITGEQFTCYCLYASLIECQCPRVPFEVERMCGCPPGTIAQAERKLTKICHPPSASHYTENFCHKLDIPYYHIFRIKKLIDACHELRMVTPQSLNAVMIYIYTHYHLEATNRIGLSISCIADACGVSKNTITKLVARIDPTRITSYDLMIMPRFYTDTLRADYDMFKHDYDCRDDSDRRDRPGTDADRQK